MKTFERERYDWIIILIILVIGFLGVILAGGWALRFSPSWELNANMESRLDPNSDFLTHKPDGFIEPIDPLILTPPVWIDSFFNPDAPQIIIKTPFPTTAATLPAVPTEISYVTNTAVVTTIPTSTIVSLPWKASSTPRPASTKAPTHTSLPPVDLQITKSDGVDSYTAGGILTYTVTATNNSAVSVTGVLISDNIPSQIASWTWSCTSQNAGASGCDGVVNSSASFSDSVDLPGGASVVYTVSATTSASSSGDLTNTATISLPGYTDPVTANNSSTDTDAQTVIADLSITKTDGGAASYTPGGSLTYTVIVTNSSPFAVSGATVTDVFSAQVAGATWFCTPDAGAACTASGTGNINDTVDIPAGLSVTYTINATISPFAVGTLVNTASVNPPAGLTETDASNNSAAASIAGPAGALNIGLPDNVWTNPASGTSITMVLDQAIVASGNSNYDFVYHERRATPTTVELDQVQIELSSNGSTWQTVFYWGGGGSDANTNMAIPVGGSCPAETDNCSIPLGSLYNSTGIAIDIDSLGLSGSYPWIRITAPGGDSGGDGCDVDAIQILP